MLARHHVFAALALAIAAPVTAAAGPLQVVSKVLAETKQRAADGTTRVTWGPAHKIVPGDRVVLMLEYHNTGAVPLGGVVLDNPVPAGMAYRGPADGSPAPELSADGKAYGNLGALRVRAADGSLRAANADDVTHVRWRLSGPVTAGGKGEFGFQAILK
jgi:uncharacterized repeat protein (TIGR01451 family)